MFSSLSHHKSLDLLLSVSLYSTKFGIKSKISSPTRNFALITLCSKIMINISPQFLQLPGQFCVSLHEWLMLGTLERWAAGPAGLDGAWQVPKSLNMLWQCSDPTCSLSSVSVVNGARLWDICSFSPSSYNNVCKHSCRVYSVPVLCVMTE